VTTRPGFSSRISPQHVQQFPQRDEASVSIHNPEAGFSNSDPVESAPKAVLPEIVAEQPKDPGYSNTKAPKAAEAASSSTEEPKPAKKAAKKSAKAAKKS
jgi:hypothetical protein